MRRVYDRLGLRDLVICYGMTETSPVSVMTAPSDPLAQRCASVGRVMPHTAVRITDPADPSRVLPLGTPGELLPWVLAALVVMPSGLLLSRLPATSRLAEQALVEAVVVAGLAMLVVSVYLVVIIGLARSPVGPEREVLVASVVAALAEQEPTRVADEVAAIDASLAQRARRCFVGFGTCSISDPVTGLLELGLIQESTP